MSGATGQPPPPPGGGWPRIVGSARAARRRLGTLPTIAFGVVGVIAVGVAGWAIMHRGSPLMTPREETEQRVAADASKLLGRMPWEGDIPAERGPDPAVIPAVVRPPPARAPDPAPTPAVAPQPAAPPPVDDLRAAALREAWQSYYRAQQMAVDQRNRLALAALTADTAPGGAPGGGGGAGGQDGATGGGGLPAGVPGIGGGGGGGAVVPRPGTLYQGPSRPGAEYLQATVTPALGRYELKEGDFIPCGVDGGITSDAPGVVKMLVSDPVKDGSGLRTLIPKDAELVGRYDERTQLGQDRLPVGITRVIFPPVGPHGRRDSLSLGSMPATDAAGYAGLRDQVDRRIGRVILNGVISFLFSASSRAASVGLGDAGGMGGAVGSAAGSEIGNVGQGVAPRNFNGPTFRVRPGFPCGVRLTQDIIFPGEWIDGVGFVSGPEAAFLRP